MRINDRRVCAELAEQARGDETPSQLVRRLLEERAALQSEVQTLRRQLRYQCQRVRMYQEEERAQRARPAEHLTAEQARGIALAREEWLQR